MATYYAYEITYAPSETIGPVTTPGLISSINPTSIGNGDISDIGGDTVILGDVSNDQFNFNGPLYTYVGATNSTLGGLSVSGFVAQLNTSYYLFVPDTSTVPTISADTVDEDEVWNLNSDAPGCLLEGTLVQTHDGERLVENLRAGDLVITADGTTAPIRWIGHTQTNRHQPDPLSILPIRIRAGALGENLPARDLLLSPDHAVFIDGTLVQAGALVNGRSVVREWNAPKSFNYYHVELEAHALILAEGAPVETFVDNVDRMSFDNWEEHLQQFGELESIPEMDYPRAKSARQVPSHVRRIIDREQRKFAIEVAA
ncbi:MAG: Hint domain-containing protein [Defluviicoccus sp.]|nr:MAG: Hint domain-containing protein [Defluviicoccus sp.]